MAAVERFIHQEQPRLPVLVKTALAHVQFETIHPFLDGNGRVGRLLIALMRHHASVLSQPLLYLSLYFKQHRAEYYRLLDAVRVEGDWEAWLDFFLEGVETTATGAVHTTQHLIKIFKKDTNRIQEHGRPVTTVLQVYHALRERPAITLSEVCHRTGLSFPTATKGMSALLELSIARKLTRQKRNRVFVYDQYLSILSEGTEPL
jgi:Fic family protein